MSAQQLRLRVRAAGVPDFTHTCDAKTATIGALQEVIADKTGIAAARQQLFFGFPKQIELSVANASTLLSSLVKTGETLHVKELAAPSTSSSSSAASAVANTDTKTDSKSDANLDEDELLARALALSEAESNSKPASATPVPKTKPLVRRVIDHDNRCCCRSERQNC